MITIIKQGGTEQITREVLAKLFSKKETKGRRKTVLWCFESLLSRKHTRH